MTRTITLTDIQAHNLLALIRGAESRRDAERAQLLIEGATAGMLAATDQALAAIRELEALLLYEGSGDAEDRAALDAATCNMLGVPVKLYTDGKTIRAIPHTSGIVIGADEDAMLQRALGVGPVAGSVVDESGATGTMRSDWGERGEKDEQP